MTIRRQRLLPAAVVIALVLAPLPPQLPPPAAALELRGMTYFEKPPWKLVFRNYYSTVFERGGEYYFTIVMPDGAGAGLGALEIQQTAGADWGFSFAVERTRAFLGEPRREGPAVPVQAQFDPDLRRFRLDFPAPPAPGQTVTVALRPYQNPGAADIYLFTVVAVPAGQNPVSQPVGVARMPIYDGMDF